MISIMQERGIHINGTDITDEQYKEITKLLIRCLYCGFWVDIDEVEEEICFDCFENLKKKTVG